jgi:hypothetical protein
MIEPFNSPPAALQRGEGRRPGRPGIGAIDVHKAADALLREGQRPTVERIRARVGRGSPNTIQPLLDDWWRTLAARIDAGPAALHRIPEAVLHIVEALWLQVLEDARGRALEELSHDRFSTDQRRQEIEVRSYVLSLREGELVERLRSRDHKIAQLRDELATATRLLRELQAERAEMVKRRRPPLQRKRPKHTGTTSTPVANRSGTPRARGRPRKPVERSNKPIPPKRRTLARIAGKRTRRRPTQAPP